MKIPKTKILSLALPVAASLLLGSCVSDGHRGGAYRAHGGGGYVTYASLPPNYSGDSYYYNNRYYAGGRYETGRYSYGGRAYGSRYYHNGRYIYGGTYRQYPARTVQTRSPRSTGSGYVTYTTLPRNYAGSAYYYNNRYYAGGRYEPGRYSYQGRTYSSRYYHNGQYLYGGTHRQPAAIQVANRGQVQRNRPRGYGYGY